LKVPLEGMLGAGLEPARDCSQGILSPGYLQNAT
jgi:hypothetical protein